MKRYVFLGACNTYKLYFIKYLSRLLSIHNRVLLVTDNQILREDMDCYEFCGYDIRIVKQWSEVYSADYDYIMTDMSMPCRDIIASEQIYFMTGIDFFDLKKNKHLFDWLTSLKNNTNEFSKKITKIYYNIISESKINKVYLNAYLEMFLSDPIESEMEYVLELNEADYENITENQHDNILTLRHLSSKYQNVLSDIIMRILDIDRKEFKKIWKEAERTMVTCR